MPTVIKKRSKKKKLGLVRPKGTGIPQLVLRLRSRMTSKEIEEQIRKQRVND